MAGELTAEGFVERLQALKSREELLKHTRFFKFDPEDQSEDNYFIGVRMGDIFQTSKEFAGMTVDEIEKLIDSPIYEARTGALSIMGKSAAEKKVSPERLKELYELYIRRHDRIDDWGLVDLGAHQVVGRYLEDKPRDILYELARSDDWWRRRTAIVATAAFIKKGEVEDTYRISEILLEDEEDLVHKGAGWMLRYAGDKDRAGLLEFLDKYAAKMPRVMLRYSIEKLDKDQREHYMGLKATT
jgi:3-methyladenine DNA glycosylase AlkD